MSIKDEIEDIQQSLEYRRDTASEVLDNLPYEQFWEDKDEAVNYVNEQLSETNWQTTYSSREDAIYHFAIDEQQKTIDRPQTTVSPKTTSSPF